MWNLVKIWRKARTANLPHLLASRLQARAWNVGQLKALVWSLNYIRFRRRVVIGLRWFYSGVLEENCRRDERSADQYCVGCSRSRFLSSPRVPQDCESNSYCGEYLVLRLGIEVLLWGRERRGTRKISPGISQEVLRNFLRESALSGDRQSCFSFQQL